MEITNNDLQTVAVNENVIFSNTSIRGCSSIIHMNDSGLVTLRGLTNNQCRARFRVSFGANIAIPTGATVSAATESILSVAINGEAVPTSRMVTTTAAAAEFNNVSTDIFIDVPAGCCTQISIKNVGAQAVAVQNANLIVERVA